MHWFGLEHTVARVSQAFIALLASKPNAHILIIHKQIKVHAIYAITVSTPTQIKHCA